MKVFTSVKELRAELDRTEQSGIGFVPTMGALHAGQMCIRDRLDIGEIFRHVGNELRQHDRKSDRRIEERLGVRMRTRQLRRPVVATRKGQVVGCLLYTSRCV